MTENARAAVRIVLVTPRGQSLQDWQARLIDRIAADPRFEFVGQIEGEGRRADPAPSPVLRMVLAGERALMHRRIRPYDTGPARRLLDSLVNRAPAQADLALALSTGALSDGQLAAVGHGEWSVTFSGAADPSWIGAARDIHGAATVDVDIIARSADHPSARVVRRAGYNPKPGAVLTGAFVAEKSVLLMLRALWDLAAGRAPDRPAPLPLAAPAVPGVTASLGYAAQFARIALRKLREESRTRQGRARVYWRLASGTGALADLSLTSAARLPALTHTMADPFLFHDDGSDWLFYEAMNADDGDGWIAAARLVGDGLETPVTALARPYHLSFPFVFRDGGDIYMMPETCQSQRLEVWRATRFPTDWVLHATAFEGQHLADSSLFKAQDGQWWLLTNLSDHHAFQDHSSELYLFAVDGPDLTSIVAHPDNPVAIGADHARNAGAIIRQDGRLFRPSQNNSFGVYGYGLNLMEISRLDATAFDESLIRRFTPADRPGITGIHHLSVAGDRYVFDWSGQ